VPFLVGGNLLEELVPLLLYTPSPRGFRGPMCLVHDHQSRTVLEECLPVPFGFHIIDTGNKNG